jgi:hypothetical protein
MNSNRYPFLTKAQIREQITALESEDFITECVSILQRRQTELELAINTTIVENFRGWNSSDAHRMAEVADRIAAGEGTADDFVVARLTVVKYTKQLALHFRREHLKKHPELMNDAQMFGVAK